MNIIPLYFLLIPIIIYLVLTTPIKIYDKQWFIKLILIYCGLISMIISLIFNNVFEHRVYSLVMADRHV